MSQWLQLADDLVMLRFPFRAFGIDFARNVTLLRLRAGRLIIHSTAPFAPEDIAAIRGFGEAGWLVEATRLHDTFAEPGKKAFATLPYLAPPGFEKWAGLPTLPLIPPPQEWNGEIDVLEIEGLRWPNEHAFLHRSSRTLIVADLLFHFPPETPAWDRFFIRHIMRLPRLFGISVFFRFMIRDRAAFARSMRTILAWDFERIVVAHRAPILQDAKDVLREALRERNLIDRV